MGEITTSKQDTAGRPAIIVTRVARHHADADEQGEHAAA